MKFTAFITILIAILAVYFKTELYAAAVACTIQISLYANNYFFLSLFFNGFTPENSHFPSLNMGNHNILTMKWIYVFRYMFKDQFFMSSLADETLTDIETRLHKQFNDNGWNISTFSEVPVPTIQWGDISPEEFHSNYVVPGVPVILKNVPTSARELWSPEFFASNYGEHEIDVVNTITQSVLRMNMSRYVDAHRSDTDPERGTDTWYIRALSDIFDAYPELSEQVNPQQFGEYLKSRFITSQIFMGMVQSSGTSYHCANFNNLFFQIQGRKKWTFVSPQYNALMYPMFNEKSMDVASFVTTVALGSDDIMKSHFPLYQYAPKMTAVLEPGDVLMNPPWQWHMIENLEPVSIGVATRWFLSPGQKYQNAVHSTLQFLSPYIWYLFVFT